MVNSYSYVRGPLLSKFLDKWSYRLYGLLSLDKTVDHISGMECIICDIFTLIVKHCFSPECGISRSRVIKTTRQTFPHVVSYPDVVRHVVKEDGLVGLFGRGLKTRLIANGMQGHGCQMAIARIPDF